MTDRAEVLLRQVLALPRADRADLAAELLASLDEAPTDDPDPVREAWIEEIERRAQKALTEGSGGEDWSQARERIARRHTGA